MSGDVWRAAAVDVDYPADGGAVAAAVLVADHGFAEVVEEHVVGLAAVPVYRPGSFFLRELPAIAAVLAQASRVDLLVVDGYVTLDPAGRPGLGAHAHERFGLPVVGVAKTTFHGATHAVEVRRGGAVKPLYVTSAGLSAARAAALVAQMAGPYRMPTALKRVDSLARGRSAPVARAGPNAP